MTLYDDLGVTPDADPATIKRAHRKAAKQHHPDAGGDAERFAIVQRAYVALSDPEMRQRYDQTGQTEDRADRRDGAIMTILVAALDYAIAEAGENFEAVNLVARMREFLKLKRREGDQAAIKVEREGVKLRKLLGRFKHSGNSKDSIGIVLNSRIAQFVNLARQIEEERALIDEAVLQLDAYGYEFTPRQTPEGPATMGGWIDQSDILEILARQRGGGGRGNL